ncbi:Uncharacterised protein [Fusobacterium necrophorum subsp. necrophorum]|nr:Uncharacterised protein [Fusobacterium necrophorum subsp. necrophorum]
MKVVKKYVCVFFLLASSICFAKEKIELAFNEFKELKEISDIMDIINENYVDTGEHEFPENLMQGALKGMVESLEDPHSTYLQRRSWKALKRMYEESMLGSEWWYKRKSMKP